MSCAGIRDSAYISHLVSFIMNTQLGDNPRGNIAREDREEIRDEREED